MTLEEWLATTEGEECATEWFAQAAEWTQTETAYAVRRYVESGQAAIDHQVMTA